MPTTPSDRLGLVRPADGDFINTWPNVNRQALDLIDDIAVVFNTTDPRPAAGVPGRFHRHPAPPGVISYDTGTTWVQVYPALTTKVFLESRSFLVAGVVNPANVFVDVIPPVIVPVAAGQTTKLTKVVHKTDIGIVTYKLQRNGVDVPGATGLTAESTTETVDFADVTLADNDRIQPIVTAVATESGSDPQNLSINVVLEHTV